MSNKQRSMVGDAKVYMLAEILRNSVSLIMLPIYTRYLTPEDYGTVELLNLVIDFATIIFGARATEAIFRFYCTSNTEEEKNSVIASSLFLSVLMGCIGAFFVIILSEPLAIAVFSDSEYQELIILFAITMALMPLIEVPFSHIRAMQKPWLFLSFSVMKLTIQVSLNIYFVVYKEMHVEGVVYSALIAFIINGTMLTVYSLSKSGINITKKVCIEIFSFSLPIKIATAGAFFLTFGDRYILNIYTDLSQVGIYSLGYKFGFIFTILAWMPFEKMWDAEKYVIHKQVDAKETYQKVFLYMNMLLFSVGLGISLFVKDLLIIMSDSAFWAAYEVVPVIILAYIFQAWGRYCSLGIMLSKKTMQLAYAQWVAVFVIAIAYFTLIPEFGIYGAAWATVIGFMVRFYWMNKKGKEYYDMNLPWEKVSIIAVLAMSCYVLSLLVPETIVISLLLRGLLLVIFCVSLLALPILKSEQKKEVLSFIKGFLKKRKTRAV